MVDKSTSMKRKAPTRKGKGTKAPPAKKTKRPKPVLLKDPSEDSEDDSGFGLININHVSLFLV
jgi:hypothetical protein